MQGYMTPKEAAKQLNLSRQRIHILIRTKWKHKCLKVIEGRSRIPRWVIPQDAVDLRIQIKQIQQSIKNLEQDLREVKV